MKSIGIYIVLVCSYIITVLAGPTPSVYFSDNLFQYYTQEGFKECYINGLTATAKKASTLTINAYATDPNTGIRYNVGGIMADLTGSAVTKIEIPSSIRKNFSISDYVLKNAKKLKELKVESQYVSVYENSFTGVNTDINIYGKGVSRMVANYAKKILENSDPDFFQDYYSISDYDTRIYLFNIAKIVRDYKLDLTTKYGDNGAVALLLKQGSTLGLSRALRYLVVASGFNENRIIVAGDDIQHGFNLVRFDNYWYVYDAVKGTYDERSPWSFFQTMDNYCQHTLNPYYGRLYKSDVNTFVKYNGKIGYANETSPEKVNLKSWLSSNQMGVLA